MVAKAIVTAIIVSTIAMGARAQETFRVTLLGTGDPQLRAYRFGPATLGDSSSETIVLYDRRHHELWRLPRIPSDIASVAHRAVFSASAVDPELSIGAPFGGRRELARGGYWPVYYRGPIVNTRFALIMLLADIALGDIAYGTSPALRERRLNDIRGFHSLTEMAPAKYADRNGPTRIGFVDDRIVIEALSTHIVKSTGNLLVFAPEQELMVRFGNTTPVERAFGDLFSTYYFDLIDRIPEFQQLLDCERAVAIFRWLRETGISLNVAPPPKTESVFTPHQVRARNPVDVDQLVFTPPIIFFGQDGPDAVRLDKTKTTKFMYTRGEILMVTRSDGRSLRVYRDDHGEPVALSIEDIGDAVFTVSKDGKVYLQTNVSLRLQEGQVTGFTPLPNNKSVPESDPWAAIGALTTTFVTQSP